MQNAQTTQQDQRRKVTKKIISLCVDKDNWEVFKRTADKDERKYSNLINGYMRRYVESKS